MVGDPARGIGSSAHATLARGNTRCPSAGSVIRRAGGGGCPGCGGPAGGPERGGGGQPGRGEQGESAGRVEVAAARGGGRCGEGPLPLLGVREGVHGWRENWQEVMHRG